MAPLRGVSLPDLLKIDGHSAPSAGDGAVRCSKGRAQTTCTSFNIETLLFQEICQDFVRMMLLKEHLWVRMDLYKN